MKSLLKSKAALLFLIGFLVMSVFGYDAKACEIEMKIIKGKKEVYTPGDTIVVYVQVTLTHRACPEAIKKTKFETNGIKVIKSTQWKQTSTMDYERKLMAVVTGTKNGKLTINAIRTCDKDGGFGSLKIESVPVN